MNEVDLGVEVLDAWHARGVSCAFGEDDGGNQTLELSGPTEAVDRETANEHAAAIAAALPTWLPPAERERRALMQATPVREPDPVVMTLCVPWEERRPIGPNRWRTTLHLKRRVESHEVTDWLRESGNEEKYARGELSRQDAFDLTARWLDQQFTLGHAFGLGLVFESDQ